MRMNKQGTPGLPWPGWCFVALAVPTFYMPLAYLALAIWAVSNLFVGEGNDLRGWMMSAIQPALYVTLAMWPVYVVWLGVSRVLSWREKGYWLFMVVVPNMIGMPLFYVFMVRRYLGLEGRMGLGNGHRNALMAYLKATGKDHSPTE